MPDHQQRGLPFQNSNNCEKSKYCSSEYKMLSSNSNTDLLAENFIIIIKIRYLTRLSSSK